MTAFMQTGTPQAGFMRSRRTSRGLAKSTDTLDKSGAAVPIVGREAGVFGRLSADFIHPSQIVVDSFFIHLYYSPA